MKVLVTGGTGNLGRQLQAIFPLARSPTHRELDLTSFGDVNEYVHKLKPSLIIHTAALTGIRECEENKNLAWGTNVVGTENLLNACKEHAPRTRFVYVSTACVFFGDRGSYDESDIPNPKNYYALTKLMGEIAVRNSGLHSLIIRTNFVPREKWPYPAAFTDRFGTYLFADDLALAIQKVMSLDIDGVVHVCGDKRLSMYDLARMTTSEVKGMTMKNYNGPPLTVDMSLTSNRIKPFRLTTGKIEKFLTA